MLYMLPCSNQLHSSTIQLIRLTQLTPWICSDKGWLIRSDYFELIIYTFHSPTYMATQFLLNVNHLFIYLFIYKNFFCLLGTTDQQSQEAKVFKMLHPSFSPSHEHDILKHMILSIKTTFLCIWEGAAVVLFSSALTYILNSL